MNRKVTKKDCLFKEALHKPLKRVMPIIFLLSATSVFPSNAANNNLLINEISQQQAVRGRVVDSQGAPLPGVTVSVMGTSQGALTDTDGNFVLTNVPQNANLQFSFVGMETREIPANETGNLSNVIMNEEAPLEEVVVVGYGTIRKRDLTGSISSVKAEDIPMTSVASVAHSLQGKAAGLIVMQNSAQPGGGLDILIRGQSSINAGNEPLYVVDGFPILQLDQPGASSSDSRLSTGTQGPLNFLNPNDIASIEVLKDASATAIYGSRAANGVVLITTKRGRQGKPEVNFTGTFGVQEYLDKWDTFRDLGEWMQEINNTAYESWLGARGVYPYGGNPFGEDRKTVQQAHDETHGTADQWINDYDENGNIFRGSQPFSDAQIAANMGKQGSDWVGKLTQPGVIEQYNLSIRGGTPSTRYMTSLNYFNHDGIVKNSKLQRYTGRFNFDQDFGSRIKAQLSLLGSNTNNDNITHGDTQFENSGLIRSAIEFNPNVLYRNPDGTYPVNPIVGNRPNPLSLLHVTDNNETNRLLANASVTVEPFDNLFVKFSTGMDLSYSVRGNYFPTETLHGAQQGGDARLWNRKSQHSSNELTATYNLDLNSIHRLTLLGGYIYEKTVANSSNLSNHDFITDGYLWNNIGSGAGTRGVGSGASENMMASFLGRVNYALLDRYLLTATIRRDGSSTFAENEKWGIFPSVAVGWNMADENFMQFSKSFLNMAKWRVSWGKTGNSNIGGRHNATYNAIQGWTRPSSGSYTGVIPGRVANPDLKWETTTEWNIGLDLQSNVLNGISATFEYYTRKIEDLLQQRTTASYQYLGSVWANVGATQSQGFEATLNTRNVVRRDFSWTTDFTFTKYKDRWLRRDSEWTPNIWEIERDLLRPIYSQHALGILQKGDPIPSHHLTPQYGGTGTSTLSPGGIIVADLNGRLLDANGNPMVDERGKVILSGEPDGVIDDADRRFIGSRDPSFIIGFGNKFTYKAFDLNIYMYGMFDRIMEDPTFAAWGRSPGNMVSQQLNGLRSVQNRWMDETIFPGRSESTTHARSGAADWYYEKAWFIRAQSVSLGYTLPKVTGLANVLGAARIYLDVQNAFVITPYGGNDPETDRYAAAYPNARTFTLGVNLNF
jgi:TonB-linked SusC/RagA family outer membrane protein